MNQGKFVFSQLMSLISHTSFHTCVKRYKGDYKTKHFSCWQQFLCMAFDQLTQRESLTDTLLCLSANAQKLYHIGIKNLIAKSTLTKANENRDWQIYSDLARLQIKEAKRLYVNDSDLEVELKNNVFAIDATTIDMCLSVLWWAKFRTTKGGIKLHTQLDLKTAIPEFVHITPAAVHEVRILDIITYHPDSFYVLYRGYTDFRRLYHIQESKAFFIIRAKDNLHFNRISSASANKKKGVMCDQVMRLNNYYAAKDYPGKLRRIKFYGAQTNRMLVFLTKNFELQAGQIAQLYKYPWKIDLFFKWIKQHLKIKSFWGRNENSVKTQIWIAISVHVLVAIAKKKFKLSQSLYEILQVISICIFDRMPIIEFFSNSIQQNFKDLNHILLNIFD